MDVQVPDLGFNPSRVPQSSSLPFMNLHAHQGKYTFFSNFSGPRKKLHGMAPNGAGRFFFRLIQTLPTFWATWILILSIFIFWIFWIPNFQISRFPDFQKSGLGRAGPLGCAGGSFRVLERRRHSDFQLHIQPPPNAS